MSKGAKLWLVKGSVMSIPGSSLTVAYRSVVLISAASRSPVRVTPTSETSDDQGVIPLRGGQ